MAVLLTAIAARFFISTITKPCDLFFIGTTRAPKVYIYAEKGGNTGPGKERKRIFLTIYKTQEGTRTN